MYSPCTLGKVAGRRATAEQIAAALALLNAELDAVEAMPGSEAKTSAIAVLSIGIRELYNRAIAIRKAEMLRIRDEEKLALRPLADRFRMSMARAQQIVGPLKPPPGSESDQDA